MKEIKAVIQPQRLARVREAFRKIPDFPGMTVSRAEGSGYHPDKPQKVRIEIVSPDGMVEHLVTVIRDSCHTGQVGDGIVWVTPIEAFQRIRESS